MRSIFISFVLTMLMIGVVSAATTGDPIDGNDQPTTSLADVACLNAMVYPGCVPCWTTCVLAMMYDEIIEGNMNWGW